VKIDKPTPSGGFSQIPNDTARNMTISRRALGLLVEILSYPSDKEININADILAAKGREGRDATRAAMKELKGAGYVIEIKYQNKDGQWCKQTFASHTPEITKGLAETWQKDHTRQSVPQKTSSHRRTGNQASVSQTSVDQALLEKKIEKSTQKTEEKMRPQKPAATTENQEPHMHVRTRDPEPPDLAPLVPVVASETASPPPAPAWAAPADQPEQEDPFPVEDPPMRAGDCEKCGHPLTHYMHDVMCLGSDAAVAKFVGRTPRPAENTP
jgi:hypothetical protein